MTLTNHEESGFSVYQSIVNKSSGKLIMFDAECRLFLLKRATFINSYDLGNLNISSVDNICALIAIIKFLPNKRSQLILAGVSIKLVFTYSLLPNSNGASFIYLVRLNCLLFATVMVL